VKAWSAIISWREEMDQSVCFLIPSGLNIHPKFQLSMDVTIEALHKLGIRYNKIYCSGYFLDSIRGKLVRDFLKLDYQNAFFIDTDQEFSPLAVLQLLNIQEDIVAGVPPFKKNPESYPVDLVQKDGHPVGKKIGENLGLIQAHHVGTGFLRIKRTALEKMVKAYAALSVHEFTDEEPWIDLFGRIILDGWKFGEDKSFSKRWTLLGGQLWVYPDITFSHWDGNTPFTGNLHKYLLKLKEEQENVLLPKL
jgi:hypothetical protein